MRYRKDDFDEMTNLSKGLREKLKENYEIRKVKMIDSGCEVRNRIHLLSEL